MNPESSIFTLAEQEGKDIMTSQSQPDVASNGQPEAAPAAVEGDHLLIEMARALHSHLPEDQRPVDRMDFSDAQWARLEAAFRVAASKRYDVLMAALGEACVGNGLADYDENGEMRFQPPTYAFREEIERLEGKAENATIYWRRETEHAEFAEGQAQRYREALERILRLDTFTDKFGSQVGQAGRLAAEALELAPGETASPHHTLAGPDPEWLADLVSKVRMIARDAKGTTNLNGELVGFKHILSVAANMLERIAPREAASPADAELGPGKPKS